jgi:DNA polymerase-3 subunit beta
LGTAFFCFFKKRRERKNIMRFKCEKTDLVDALSKAERALPSRAVVPITEGIKIAADNGQVRLAATDINLRIESVVEGADVIENGEAVLDGRLLISLAKSLPDQPVLFNTASEHELTIKTGSSEITLATMSASDFPPAHAVNGNKSFAINSSVLRDLIQQTIFAVSEYAGREILTGEHFKLADGLLTVTALDGYRVARRQEKVQTDLAFEAVIPGKALKELARILPASGDIEIKIGSKFIAFDADSTTLTAQLLAGQFFDCDAIISSAVKNFRTTAIVKKDDTAAAVKRALILVKAEKLSAVRFAVDNDKIIMTAQNSTGRAVDEIPAEIKGQALEIAFNGMYLSDGMDAIDAEEITFSFGDSVDPFIIQPTNNPDSGLYLILPVRL